MEHRILFTYKKGTPPQTEYSYLYNWWAAIGDTDGDGIANTSIANTGWRLPTTSDFLALGQYADPDGVFGTTGNDAGGKLKETGTVYWDTESAGATNEFDFNARGGGYRDIDYVEDFRSNMSIVVYWNEESFTSVYARNSFITSSSDVLYTTSGTGYVGKKKNGESIRLVKESTILSHGQTGLYVGNDGKTYNTICIGTQEWLQHDLEETKYRDGTSIPYVGNDISDKPTWDALTTGAYCIYPIP